MHSLLGTTSSLDRLLTMSPISDISFADVFSNIERYLVPPYFCMTTFNFYLPQAYQYNKNSGAALSCFSKCLPVLFELHLANNGYTLVHCQIMYSIQRCFNYWCRLLQAWIRFKLLGELCTSVWFEVRPPVQNYTFLGALSISSLDLGSNDITIEPHIWTPTPPSTRQPIQLS